MYCSVAGSSALAVTIIVYGEAPLSSKEVTTAATDDAF